MEAYHRLIPDREARRQELEKLTYKVIDELAGKGYRVLDMKPEHIKHQIEIFNEVERQNPLPVKFSKPE